MLALPLLAAVTLSQGFVTRYFEPPDLTVGQRVRVGVLTAAPVRIVVGPAGHSRAQRITGLLTAYRPGELIALRRTGWIGGIGPTDVRTLDWIQVTHIEVPQRRNGLNAVQGAAGGFGAALAYGFTAAMVTALFCDRAEPGGCRSMWRHTKQAAVYSVPIGAVVGLFMTRWKRVY